MYGQFKRGPGRSPPLTGPTNPTHSTDKIIYISFGENL